MAKPSVLVLGTYHMGGRGDRDVNQLNPNDVQLQKQQREIREVIGCLKNYKPTKIAVEYETVRADVLEDQYTAYLNGSDEQLESDEIHQIGFRLAKELSHSMIYAVDWNRPPGGVPLGYIYDFLKDTNTELYDELFRYSKGYLGKIQKMYDSSSIREILLVLNEKESLKREQEQYMKFTQAAIDDFYIGIDWLANYWYRRNLIAFSNVKRLATNSNDRILVIYGSGHKYLLDQFFCESNEFIVHSVDDYL